MEETKCFQVGEDPAQNLMHFAIHTRESQFLASPGEGPFRLVDFATGEELWSRTSKELGISHPDPRFCQVAFDSSGEVAVLGCDADETFYLVETNSGLPLSYLQIPDGAPVGADFHALWLDHTNSLILINSCFATGCFSRKKGECIWFDESNGDCCGSCLHVTRTNQVLYPKNEDKVVMRDAESGECLASFSYGQEFSVSEDESEMLCYLESKGFTRLCLKTGGVLAVIPLDLPLHSRLFRWSKSQQLLVVLDDSGDEESLLALDSDSKEIVGRAALPPGRQCWQFELNPHADGSILASCDDGTIRVYQLT